MYAAAETYFDKRSMSTSISFFREFNKKCLWNSFGTKAFAHRCLMLYHSCVSIGSVTSANYYISVTFIEISHTYSKWMQLVFVQLKTSHFLSTKIELAYVHVTKQLFACRKKKNETFVKVNSCVISIKHQLNIVINRKTKVKFFS